MATRTSLFRGFEWCFRVYESSEYHVRGLQGILWNVIGVTFVIGLLVILSGDEGLYYTRRARVRKL